ncbi:hypothetical protein CKO17_04445 [Marichromatium gracile]|nr:hypothetical protein [Marichromatium gracile]
MIAIRQLPPRDLIKMTSGLKTKLNLALILVVSVVLVSYGVWDVMRVEATETARQQHDITAAFERLETGLPKPLWDFAMATVDDILRGEMGHPAIVAVAVEGVDGEFVAGFSARPEVASIERMPQPEGVDVVSRELVYTGNGLENPLGRVSLFVSPEPLRQAVHEALVRNVLIVLVLNLVLVVSVSFALTRLVLKPLAGILTRVRDIAEGEGDLSKQVESDRADELGELAQALNRFIGSIREIVIEVETVIGGLSGTAQRTSDTAGDLSRQLAQQQEDLYMLTTALNEFSATADEVARNAALVAEAGEEAGTRAGSGLDQVRAANLSNGELAESVDQAADVIGELRQSTEAITGILDVICGIADQTNLLALNAAIEAARAGEAGRGFAVVADEVRVLSQRTQESTTQIQETIAGLQRRTEQAVSAMEAGRAKSRHSVDQASAAGQAFEEIDAAIKRIIEMMSSVATAAEQQSATVAEIERNVGNIQQVHERTVAASQTTSDSGEGLAASVTRLRALFGKFRL